jgi:hypothetical protein
MGIQPIQNSTTMKRLPVGKWTAKKVDKSTRYTSMQVKWIEFDWGEKQKNENSIDRFESAKYMKMLEDLTHSFHKSCSA